MDADNSVIRFLFEAGGNYCRNYPKIPPELCNVNDKQMLRSNCSKMWVHPLITLCTKMMLLICENEFQHLGSINGIF